MSHYANVRNGIVTQVIVAENGYILSLPDFNDWVQTSYNTKGNIHYGPDGQPDGLPPLRGNYAGVGYVYDVVNDVFYQQKPYQSWTLDQSTWTWVSPVPMPKDDAMYYWDEVEQKWILIPA
jgi:hypothetical protein